MVTPVPRTISVYGKTLRQDSTTRLYDKTMSAPATSMAAMADSPNDQ
jgi:hypothetical protein